MQSQNLLNSSIPNTLEEAVEVLFSCLEQSDIDYVKQNSDDGMHFGIGMWIRNHWGLWTGGPLAQYFNSLKIGHADDMSGLILTALVRKIKKEEFVLEYHVNYYIKYWNDKNIDSLTQKPLN